MDDIEKLKKIALLLLSLLKGTEFDLLVYKAVFAALGRRAELLDIERLLEDARKDPVAASAIHQKYEKIQRALEQFSQRGRDREILRALKSWKPRGPTN